ncbi:PorT family protein [Chitinophagaceae bacterium LB-8]|uniref:PorT family protein n=1 Tax=Paraflavisolibacter caeni TaxID=2982496 RepID=A0A9X2XNQ6_9BACT|nr:porin family protein [Paraflavisolibacter caeni]MCU7549358.1 PorT family protein [Paraflavisolibacter caeni]
MKTKFFLLTAATIFSVSIFAQKTTVTANKTTFGIRAGVNFQNINGKDGEDNKLQNDLKTGFNAGVNAEIPVGTDTYIQPGVLFTQKGTKWENSDTKIKLSYIDIPVNLLYKPVLGTGKMVVGFGPYVGFGIGGKIENDQDEVDIEFSNEHSATEGATFKRMDAGANFLAGYEFSNKLSFQLNAQLGLVDINPKVSGVSNDKTNWRNTGWGFSLGYRF